MRRRFLNAMPALVLVAALLGAWELYVDSGSTNSSILPAPHSIAVALWGNAGLLGHNLAITAEEVGVGILLALALGFVLAVLIHLSPILRRAVYPLTVGSQAVPIAVIAPLLVFLLGFGLLPKLIVIVLICFFPVVVTTVDGLAAVDPDQLKLLHTLDASRWQSFRFAELPAALPAAISGARIAVTVSGSSSSDGLTPVTSAPRRAVSLRRPSFVPIDAVVTVRPRDWPLTTLICASACDATWARWVTTSTWWRVATSAASTERPTPPMRLAVPVKYSSIRAPSSPMASKTWAPV